MVRLQSIYTANFKKLILEEPLALPEGVTLISGPNESGKSTLLDAILYALYSRVIRPSARPRNEDLITYGRSKAVVRLDFSIGERTFRVERRIYLRRPNEASLWKVLPDGRLRVMAIGQREVTNEIEKLLGGISFHEIVASNVVAQKDLERLIEQGKQDRKRVINAFLNLESFNVVLRSLNETRKALEGTPARPGRLALQQQRLESLREKLDEFNKKKIELRETKQRIKQLKKKLRQVKKDLNKVSKLYDVLETYSKAHRRQQEVATKIDGKRSLIEELKEQLEELRGVEISLQETGKRLEGYADLGEAKSTLDKVRGRVEVLYKIRIQRQEKGARRGEVVGNISDLEQRLAGVDRRKLARMAERGVLTWPFIGGAIVCFLLAFILLAMNAPRVFCGVSAAAGVILLILVGRQFSVESKFRAALADDRRLRELEKELTNLSAHIETMDRQISDGEEEILSDCKGIRRYSSIFLERCSEGPLVIAKAMLEALDKDEREKSRLEERWKSLNDRLKRRPEVLERQQAAEKELDELQRAFKAVKYPRLPRGIEFSEELLEEIGRRREKLRKELVRNKTWLMAKKEEFEKLTKFIEGNKGIPGQVKRQAELVKSLKRELDVVRLAIEGVDKTAKALRSRVKPSVEQYMGIILPAITNGRYKAVQLDENYDLKVWDPDAGEFKVKEVFSGGTEDQFLLSMRLAFALALLPEVKGMHPEFLFLDEPLGSSDAERRQGIIQLINAELSARFKQIFLISHVADLETEVQNVIRLENGRVIG